MRYLIYVFHMKGDEVMLPYLIALLALVIGVFALRIYFFEQETYHQVTHNSYFNTKQDLGRNGEYLIYKQLKKYEKEGGRFLFNCYLPKDDGTTTEIDVMLICATGIYVFESKNYSGWIFGDEKGKTWTQTLPNGRRAHKEHFFNPIMQNNLHIKWLKKLIGENIPIHSVIAFSERCELKKVTMYSRDILVVKRNHVKWAVSQLEQIQTAFLSDEEIQRIYNILYPYTQVTEEVKQKHINNLRQEQKILKEQPFIKNAVPEFDSVIVQSPQSVPMQSVTSLPCPWCGSPLVMRTAKKGSNIGKQFWGCSTYPKCKYVGKV